MKPIRLLHLTDIHFRSVPKLRELTLKRTFGLINQFAMGRKDEFSDVVQLACIRKALQLNPSAVVISGDLTAMALESEFIAARQALLPLLNSRPSFVIPGNHDCYTQKAIDSDLIGKYFGEFMHRQSNSSASLELDNISIVGMNPCRPILLESTGYFPQAQLDLLTQSLQRQSSSSNVVILATHYPVLDRSSAPYHLKHPKHGVRNGQAFIDVVQHASAGNMILHGHDHHGFRQKLVRHDKNEVHIFNPGAAGQVKLRNKQPHNRSGAFNVYSFSGISTHELPTSGSGTVLKTGNGTQVVLDVERYVWDDQTGEFELEHGGPYSSKW